jgi:hypothetical protein
MEGAMNRLLLSAGFAAAMLFVSAPAAAQFDRPTSPAPPPWGMDAVSSGIGERAARLHGDLDSAFARGAISRGDADAIGSSLARIERLLSYHLPRGYHERVRLRARLDDLQAQLDRATHRG